MKKTKFVENIIQGIFLILGLITVAGVLLITIYLVIAGVPAIREIGLFDFLFGKTWASTAAAGSQRFETDFCSTENDNRYGTYRRSGRRYC